MKTALKKRMLVVGILLISLNVSSQTGPGGVGTNGAYDLGLWLQANTGVTSSGGNVSQWNDQSGNENNVIQSTLNNQPNLVTSVLNGFPVIRFTKANGDNLVSATFTTLDRKNHTIFFVMSYDKANSDNDGGIIATSNTSIASTIILKKNGSAFEYQGTASTKVTLKDPADFVTHKIYVLQRDSATSTLSTWRNGENTINALAIGINTAYQFSLFKFGVNRGGTKFSTMDMAEAIVYFRKVNSAERLIVRNYLSSKYGLILTVGDKYAGDTSTNGEYDYNVIGIGKESDGSQATSSSSGLVLDQVSGFDNGDYLMAGHKTTGNSINNTDIAGIGGTKSGRWNRIWYFDKTDASTAMSVNVSFDFSDGGMVDTPKTSPNYKLIYRSGQSGSWTVVATASSISGDRVVFNDIALADGDGYYTLASLDTTVSPLPVELMFFKGTKVENGALLNWQTASETNNDFFTILKSVNGKDWEEIGAISGVGNSVNVNKYEFLDEDLKTDSYYKLKQTDYDGQYSVSKAIIVKQNSQAQTYSITPNPNKGIFEIKGKVINPDKVSITDYAGKNIYFSFQVTEHGLRIEINEPKPGIYIINIPAVGSEKSAKLKLQLIAE